MTKQPFELPMHFWSMPKTANITVDSKQWKQIVLQTDCRILANGEYWTVKRKPLGSGMYKVTLAPFEAEKETNKSVQKQTELKIALNYMIDEYEKATGISRKELPAFVTSAVK